MISVATRRKGLVIRLVIALVGLSVIMCSELFPEHVAGIPAQEIMRELATFVVASLLVHWIYDTQIKHELFQDIADYVVRKGNVSRSGISDYYDNTKDIDYSALLQNSYTVTIGLHYSPRILEDNFHLLASRAQAGKKTTLIAALPKGSALKFLKSIRGEGGHIDGNVNKIRSLVDEINKVAKVKIELLYHDEVLRYSFVLGDEQVWVKLYRNSSGMSFVPGFAVATGTKLYDFYKEDIEKLTNECPKEEKTPQHEASNEGA